MVTTATMAESSIVAMFRKKPRGLIVAGEIAAAAVMVTRISSRGDMVTAGVINSLSVARRAKTGRIAAGTVNLALASMITVTPATKSSLPILMRVKVMIADGMLVLESSAVILLLINRHSCP